MLIVLMSFENLLICCIDNNGNMTDGRVVDGCRLRKRDMMIYCNDESVVEGASKAC